MSLTVTTEHYNRVQALRVDAVIFAIMTRPERLYAKQKFIPDPGVQIIVKDIPPEKNSFNTVEEMLAAVNRWCQ